MTYQEFRICLTTEIDLKYKKIILSLVVHSLNLNGHNIVLNTWGKE